MLNQEVSQLEQIEFQQNLDLTNIQTERNSYLGKRFFDFSISLLIFVVFGWWVILIAMFFAWIELPKSSPIFIQKRVGKNGKTFHCFKIRTMIPNENSEIEPVKRDDSRITPIGKLLRKTNIDELPQLINVLIGNMSLVGPRPYMIFEDQLMNKALPNFYKRNSILPGITGFSQVRGLHNLVSNDEVLAERLNADLEYLSKSSFRIDMVVLWSTLCQFLGVKRSNNSR